jgi:putative FmdB family regulatory protein
MPIYEFECEEHGVFEEQRPMSLAKSNAPCPSCGSDARRLLSVPQLARLAPTERRARDINERSSHEPRIVQRHAVPPAEPAARKLQATHGRPWAIGH